MSDVLLMDLGGTGSRALFYRASDGAISKSEGSGANPYRLGATEAERVLSIHLSDLGLSNQCIGRVLIGMAGVSSPYSRSVVDNAFRSVGITGDIRLISDAELTHMAGFGVKQGVSLEAIEILVIAGTGSIAVSFSPLDGGLVRAGGLGHDNGDEGSGNWIGGKLKNLAQKDVQLASHPALQKCVANAGFGSVVDVPTAQGAVLTGALEALTVTFPAAHDLALQAGQELAKIVSSVYAQQLELYKQCGYGGSGSTTTAVPGTVKCYGSVIKHCSTVRRAFKDALEPCVSDTGDVVDVLPQLLESLLQVEVANS